MKPELSNQKIHPDYFIAVYYNGEVIKLSNSAYSIPDNSSVRFIIHCEYSHPSEKGYGIYYKNKIFNNSNNRIEDNIFNWEGYKCKLHEDEVWGDIKDIWVRLRMDVWDKFDVVETIEYDNASHDGWAFRELFIYLQDLAVLQSHSNVKFVRNLIAEKDALIAALEKRIEELENSNRPATDK